MHYVLGAIFNTIIFKCLFLLFRETLSIATDHALPPHFQSLLAYDMSFFCLESRALFTSTPCNPSFALEGQNITLVWNYTLSDHVYSARFYTVTEGGSMRIAIASGGSTFVESNFQERFRANISDTQARLIILKAQTSDQGRYRFYLLSMLFLDSLRNTVELIVQCK